jgi:hypothetical protein
MSNRATKMAEKERLEPHLIEKRKSLAKRALSCFAVKWNVQQSAGTYDENRPKTCSLENRKTYSHGNSNPSLTSRLRCLLAD